MALKELAISSILNKYLLLALRVSILFRRKPEKMKIKNLYFLPDCESFGRNIKSSHDCLYTTKNMVQHTEYIGEFRNV